MDDKDKDDAETFNIAPRIMTEFSASNVRRYQLRAYIYQARGLLGADATGYSDPYARVVFGNRSGLTAVINQTCSPLWDTSVILDNIEICGDKSEISANPPDVVIEFFDEDALVSFIKYSTNGMLCGRLLSVRPQLDSFVCRLLKAVLISFISSATMFLLAIYLLLCSC